MFLMEVNVREKRKGYNDRNIMYTVYTVIPIHISVHYGHIENFQGNSDYNLLQTGCVAPNIVLPMCDVHLLQKITLI